MKKLEGEHFLIVGFSRTGIDSANFLLEKGFKVSITDNKSEKELSENIAKLKGKVENIFTGDQEISQLKDITKIVLSPGVPRTINLLKEAKKRNIPILSEIQLAYYYLPENVKILGITGTDGKSTTVSLVYEIIKTQYNAFLCGNIGTTFISYINDIKSGDIVVLELSSYQLEENETFKCNIAAILNISEDHLDRYDSMDSYISAKENILRMQDNNDIAVLNFDSPYFERHKKLVKGKLISFSKYNKNCNIFVDNNNIIYNNEYICSIQIIKIKGVHNLENSLCAVAIAKELNISNENIKSVLSSFKGLEHRNEYVKTLNGIDFINDSKATTVNAVEKAILSYEKPIILLLGGRDKGLDFSKLNSLIDQKVKLVICFGEAREKIKVQLKTIKEVISISDLKDAIELGYSKASNGDIVLLSPGCTSWDAFESYAHRGKYFKQIVETLK